MEYTSIYCTATHPRSVDGCYEMTDHTGQHRGMYRDERGDWDSFQWDGEAPAVPEGSVAVVLTAEQLFVLVGALGPDADPRNHALKLSLCEGLLELAKRK